MQTILGAVSAAFDYAAFDQATGLFVAGNVYDVSTGTPSFVQRVAASLLGLGVYAGKFVPDAGKTYLVISPAYTDGTFATIDTTRSAVADEYFAVQDSETFSTSLFAFDYTDPYQATGLFVQAKIWDITSGTPTVVASVTMSHVLAGCYFGSFVGADGHTYVAEKVVYTDSGFTTPDATRAPLGSDAQSYTFTASTPTDDVRTRLAIAGRASTSGNLAGRLSENLAITGRPLAGRVSTSNNAAGRLALIGA